MTYAKNHIDHLLNNCIDDSAESCSIMSKAKQAIGMLVTLIETHTKKKRFCKIGRSIIKSKVRHRQ